MRIGTWLLQNSQWAINHSFNVHTGNYGLCNKVIDFNGTLKQSELCFRYRFFIIKFQRPTFVRTFEQSVLQGHRFHWSIGTLRVMGLWTTGHSGGIGTRENSVCFSQTLTLEMKIIYFSVDWKNVKISLPRFIKYSTKLSKLYMLINNWKIIWYKI